MTTFSALVPTAVCPAGSHCRADDEGFRRAGCHADGHGLFPFQSGHLHPAIGSNGTHIGAERDILFRSGFRNARSFDVRLYILLLLIGYLVTCLVK
ncbi:hypothetical protein VL12_10570 [Rossellomorea marisflavi]|nr:hypothetical protein VL12_10570 [Rossellomorea marisflavi]